MSFAVKKYFIQAVFLSFSIFSAVKPLAADAQEFIPPRLKNPEASTISILTVGLGDDLASRYGHTMFRIQDAGHQLEYLVNWGLFDFSDPLFLPKFFKGILIYQMGFSYYQSALRYYKDTEHRPVWEDRLNLTAAQKTAFVDKIIWNAQPENIRYNYQYFRNNCSTTPRDYLNTILYDKIRLATESQKVGKTYREYVRSNLGFNPIVGWGLDVIFNADNDYDLNAWEEMFFPIKFQEHLATLPAYDDAGVEIPGVKLLSDHRTLVDVPEPDPRAMDGYWFVLFFATLPLLGLLAKHGFPNGIKAPSRLRDPYEWRIFGCVALFWGLTAGFFGLVHTFAWLFSAHTDLHRNLNILLFWPTDFLMAYWGVKFLIWGGNVRPSQRWQRFWQLLATAHLIVLVIYVAIGLAGITGQYVTRVLVHMVPASILFYYTVGWRVFVSNGDEASTH